MSTNPMIPSILALEAGLTTLLTSISTTLSRIHATTAPDISALSKSLALYLSYFISHNKRRSNIPLNVSNLAFHLMRTYNSTEYVVTNAGRKIKGEKSWYYVVLVEGNGAEGDVQVVVEGVIRKEKGEVLEGLIEEVEEGVLLWEEEEREGVEIGKGKQEGAQKNQEKTRAIKGKETVITKSSVNGKEKVVKERRSRLEDIVEEGEEEEELTKKTEAKKKKVAFQLDVDEIELWKW
jgi:hypothetical protein